VTVPITFSGNDCLIVTDSFFADTIGSAGGGAISAQVINLAVIDTTFLRTQATTGGAIQVYGDSLATSRCCFREASGTTGTAIALPGPSSNDVADSSFVSCAADSDGGVGTIWLYVAVLNSLHLNFSQCDLRPTDTGNAALGTAVYADRDAARYQLQYCTVLKSSGMSCLQTFSISVPTVTSCNFYDNLLAGSYAVLAADTVGMSVDSCIFNGNTVEIFLYRPIGGGARFALVNCVFSGDFPAGAYYDSVSGNIVNSITASYAIGVFGTEYCPTSSIGQTVVATSTETVALSKSAEATETISPAATVAPVTPTDNPAAVGGVSPGVLYGIGAVALVFLALALAGFLLFWKARKRGPPEDMNYDVERQGGDDAFGGTDRFMRSLDSYGSVDGQPQTAPEAFSEAIGFHAE
jgi:hypothetical protein